jgi:hypothetical protein
LKGALWYSAFVSLVARVGWFVGEFQLGSKLDRLVLLAFALPGLVILVAQVGDRRCSDPRRRVQQDWAALFLGLLGAAVYAVKVFLPDLWPILLFVPAAWAFRPLWRVKSDEAGALEVFQGSDHVEMLKEPFRALLDLFERPGWRERFEANLKAAEKEKRQRRKKAGEQPERQEPDRET